MTVKENEMRRDERAGSLISVVQKWRDNDFGPLNVENVRRHYANLDWNFDSESATPNTIPNGDRQFEVRPQSYTNSTEFSGWTGFDHDCYMLEGRMSLTLGDETVILSAGDFCSFAAGSYVLKNLDGTKLEFINVYDLPATEIWP